MADGLKIYPGAYGTENKYGHNLPALSSSVDTVEEAQEACKPERDCECLPNLKKHLTAQQFRALVDRFGRDTMTQAQWLEARQKVIQRKQSQQQQQEQRKTQTQEQTPAATEAHSGIRGASQADDSPTTTMIYSEHDERKKPQAEAGANIRAEAARRSTTGLHARNDRITAHASKGPGPLRRASSVVHGFVPGESLITPSPLARTPTMIAASSSRQIFFFQSSPSDTDTDDAVEQDSDQQQRPQSPVQQRTLEQPSKRKATFRDIVDEASGYESSPFDSDEESDREQDKLTTGKAQTSHQSFTRSSLRTVGLPMDEASTLGSARSCSVAGADDDDWASIGSDSPSDAAVRGIDGDASGIFDKIQAKRRLRRPPVHNRKSLLSTMLIDGSRPVSNIHSKSSPAIAQSRPVSPVARSDLENSPRGSLSPRSTRRSMMAKELSESLRRHLLWERQQKSFPSQQSDMVLQRRHTVYDLARLRDMSVEKTQLRTAGSALQTDMKVSSQDEHDFGYHQAGW
ncbi:hypothetical protein PYCC9005_003560 [Savitreella phatthalungensis]